MAESRRRDEWERTAFLRFDIRKCFGGTGETPDELNPYTAETAKRGGLRISDPKELAMMWGVTDGL